MRDDATGEATGVQLRRLYHALGKPFATDLEAQGEEWKNAFRRQGIPMMAVERAVSELIDGGKKFPTLGAVIEAAKPYIPRTDGQRNADPDSCVQCGSGYFYAGYHFAGYAPRGLANDSRATTVLPKLRCACPQEDPAWYTPAALDWCEDDVAAHQGRAMPRDYRTSPRYRVRPTAYRPTVEKTWQRATP